MTDRTFSFGRNWSAFLDRCLTPERLARARADTAEFLAVESLEGRSFLDIGCGSGLFSSAAYELGASRIVSFDVDPFSVKCCELLRERAGSPPNWTVLEGSVLDCAFMQKIAPADIVYSWGVLHHTGDMWTAIRNAARLVNPGGEFLIAIYNRLEYDFLKSWRGSHGWLKLKRVYNNGSALRKRLMEAWFAAKDLAAWTVSLQNPVRRIRNYQSKRGMSWWYDIVDWLGGYPYEFASPGEVFMFCRNDVGFELHRLQSTCSLGCNQFLFHRPALPSSITGRTAATIHGDVDRAGVNC